MLSLDPWLLEIFIESRSSLLTPMIIVFTVLSGPTLMWCYALIFGLTQRSAYPPIAVGAANLISHYGKKIIDRPRPDPANHLVNETNAALPSGHAVGAAAFAMVITLMIRSWWVLAVWLLALLVGISRLYVGVHWPTDLIVGWALGAAVAWVAYLLLRIKRT